MSDPPAANPHRFYGMAAGLLGALAIAIGIAELAGLAASRVAAATLAGSIGMAILVAWRARHGRAVELHLGGRGLTPFYLGLAGSADWLGAVFLIGIPATLYAQGAIGLAVVVGGAAGYVLAAVLLAPGLARSSALTVPDFLARRYQSEAVRRLAAIMLAGTAIGLALAQAAALAVLGTRLFGLDPRFVFGALLAAVLACALPGGAAGGQRAQVVLALVALAGFLVPLTVLAARFTGVPLPQVMYGPVVERVEAMEASAGVPAGLAALPDAWTFAGIAACLAFGVVMLPQLAARHLAASSARAARGATGWSLLFVVLALTTAPAYAAFVKSEVLANLLGQPISALPNWVNAWSTGGFAALGICDATEAALRVPLCAGLSGDGNGVLEAAELRLLPSAIVLLAPAIADLPFVVTAMAAAGLAAAALAAIGGGIVAAASVVAVDLARRPQSVVVPRIAAAIMSAVAIGLAAALEVDGLRVALCVLALAACGLSPALVLGIWSRRGGGAAAIVGMLAGLLLCFTVLLTGMPGPRTGGLTLERIAASMLGLPAGFLAHWLLAWITDPPGGGAQAMIDRIRQPRRR
ncbi:sodium:solute symporter family transporter [Desertibaculum subflavum]|uniref:sodium:solute symporter family transporter n=1 Tax=Desertibaculum subflavum TaxID=2268458 RepID=UPI000E66C654